MNTPRRISVLLALAAFSTAGAWKPATHMYLAEEALRDALDDGNITVNVLLNGHVQISPATGQPITRQYAVDPDLLAALRANPSQYRAGVTGPDAYPDILTGQQVIHPGPTEGINSDKWLEHLWNTSRGESGAVKAFVAGYLTHAGGDMFGHTLIDEYTEDKFTITPPTNALKHLVLEGYIGKRTPNILKFDRPLGTPTSNVSDYVTTADLSIDGVQDYIYRQMIDAKPGTPLHDPALNGSVEGLYEGPGTDFSVPFIFSKMRAGLQQEIDKYYNTKSEYISKLKACKWYNMPCKAYWSTRLSAYVAAHAVQTTYREHWRRDIDDGLRAWPETSHEINKALVFTSTSADLSQASMNVDRAKEVGQRYIYDHLLSMAGAPDLLGKILSINFFNIDILKELKERLVDSLVKRATGYTPDELKALLEGSDAIFDQVMAQAPGKTTNLQEVNRTLLQIDASGKTNPEQRFDVMKLPAAYNTLTMSKLILLSSGEFRRLIGEFGGPTADLQPNAALGYIHSLDDNNQWRDSTSPFATCTVFSQLFMPQTGGKTMDDGNCAVRTFAKHPGMTWRVLNPNAAPGVIMVGVDDQSNVYQGDTANDVSLSVMCLKQDGRPVPASLPVAPDFYHGWAHGEVRFTPPVVGADLSSLDTANSWCARTFGPEWRMAEFHDGQGGFRYYADSASAPTGRFWVHINDQRANSWSQ